MRSLSAVVPLTLLMSCAPGGACQNPVLSACSQKAQEIASELDKVAAQRHTTSDDMTNQFMGACEGQLQADLDQTLANIQAIAAADAGTPAVKDNSK